MKNKFSTEDKRNILGQYEKGKPAVAFTKEYHCGIRAVNAALDDARRERDATHARSELMKEALHNHQKRLEEEMRRIFTSLEVPEVGFTLLSWYDGDNSIISTDKSSTLGLAKKPGRPSSASTTATDLLRQHLKSDSLWKLLVQNDKAHAEHINYRIAFQRKVVDLLETNTGYKMLFKPEGNLPFLCSYTTGPAVYESSLRVALEGRKKEEFINELVCDMQSGEIKYRHNILIQDRGNEKKCLQNILDTYNELLESPLLDKVKESREELSKCHVKVKRAIDEIVLLEYIPGSCSSCQKLGM
ncbi:MAG: hypothetical protein ABR886_12095 [Dehalococcoidales bacterium]|jgi:hypothetical protein